MSNTDETFNAAQQALLKLFALVLVGQKLPQRG
jgi:hypothetical protein